MNVVNLEEMRTVIREKKSSIIQSLDEKLCSLKVQITDLDRHWGAHQEEVNGVIQPQGKKVDDYHSMLQDFKSDSIKYLKKMQQTELDLQSAITKTDKLLHQEKQFQDTIKLNEENLIQNKAEAAQVQQDVEQKIAAYTKTLELYSTFLGLDFVRTDNDMWFTFKYINNEEPDEIYAFRIRILDNKYQVIACRPMIPSLDQLVARLNETDDLSEFVQKMRKEFCILAKSVI